jgi:hypothetical protein
MLVYIIYVRMRIGEACLFCLSLAGITNPKNFPGITMAQIFAGYYDGRKISRNLKQAKSP